MAIKKQRPLAFVPGEARTGARSASRPASARKARARSAPAVTPPWETKKGLALGSGRTLHVRSVDTGETLEVRSAEGTLEVSITLGAGGPVVSIHGARELELASPKVAVSCDTFELDAKKAMRLGSQGEIKLKAEGDVVVNGALVKLNCDEAPPAP